jgi:hypothetical protein
VSTRPTRSIAAIATLLAVLCMLAASSLAPAASASPAPSAGAAAVSSARALARTERQQRHDEEKLHRVQAREARRAARQADRAAKRAEREEGKTTRAAERAARALAREHGDEPGQGQTQAQGDGKPSEEKPAGEAQAPAQSTAPGDCSISASASSPQVTVGEAVTLTGKLTCPAAGEEDEQAITVYEHERGAGNPTLAGTVTTAADGSFHLETTALTARSTFTLQAAHARHHARVVVLMGAQVTLDGPAPTGASLPMSAGRNAGGPAAVTFSGTIQPQQADRMVALKARYAGADWRTIAFTRTDSSGHFRFSRRFRFAGEVTLVATARPHGSQRAESSSLTYTITQAQNPAVTIQLSSVPTTVPALTTPSTATPATPVAAPIASPTTISGVAAGSPHTTATLLTLSPDGHFAAVATVQTDAAGAYSFTVEPTATTIYKVKCAGRRSAPVRVLVSP